MTIGVSILIPRLLTLRVLYFGYFSIIKEYNSVAVNPFILICNISMTVSFNFKISYSSRARADTLALDPIRIRI